MKLVWTLLSIGAILSAVPALAQCPYSARSTSAREAGGADSTTFGGTRSGSSSGYLIGASTSEVPRHFAASGTSPASGVSSRSGMGLAPGQFFYYNNPGIGYYRTNPSSSVFPAYPSPINLGGGYFQLGGMSSRMGYWRSPSGYYYPWCPPVFSATASYRPTSAIYMMEQGVPTVAQPSVVAIITDMREFIEDVQAKKQLDNSSCENLSRRLNAVSAQVSELSERNGGALPLSDDKAARHVLDLLSADLARALMQ